MTPSPSPTPTPTPTSSPSSRPGSSPTNTAFQDTQRPSFVPPILPPISQISFQAESHSLPPYMGVSRPFRSISTPEISGSSTKPSWDGKRESDDSIAPTPSGTWLQATEEDNPVDPEEGAGASGSTSGDPEQSKRPQGKKKRTRTLTTPHQSAVLHALLAQSRFPTTAMREEVGRSIGLSARKVQVWFQNQRQKARKPRSPTSAPVNRPPQFESFASGASPDSGPIAGPSSILGSFQGVNPAGTHSSSFSGTSSLPTHSRILPDDTGTLQHSQPRLPDFLEFAPNRPPAQQQQYAPSSIPQGSEQGTDPLSSTRGAGSRFTPPIGFHPQQSGRQPPHLPFPPDPYSRRPLQGPPMSRSDPPIVLPPLRFEQPRGSQVQSNPPLPPLYRVDTHAYSNMPRSASLSSMSPSDISSGSGSHLSSPFSMSQPPPRHSENIPPPFTLQPEPQWDPPNPGPRPIATFHPPVGPSRSSYSLQGYARHRTSSDPARISSLLRIGEDRPLITQGWPLNNPSSSTSSDTGPATRRFDPVHSAASEERHGIPVAEVEPGNGRRNRHTYDFGRPSSGMKTSSPEPSRDEGD